MWLLEHTPLCEKPKTQSHRVDWEKRDLQLAEDVEVAALLIKNLPGRPVHITISTIGRETGRLALLQQHLDKLPRTAGVLKEFVETREAFAVRRLWWAVTVLSQEQIYPERWLLIRKAGVARLKDQLEVKDAIDAALQILQPKVSINIVES